MFLSAMDPLDFYNQHGTVRISQLLQLCAKINWGQPTGLGCPRCLHLVGFPLMVICGCVDHRLYAYLTDQYLLCVCIKIDINKNSS